MKKKQMTHKEAWDEFTRLFTAAAEVLPPK
jgi:hypothetical protein